MGSYLSSAQIQTMLDKATPGPWYVVWTDDEDHMNAVYVGTVNRGLAHDGDLGADGSRHGEIIAMTLLQEPRMVSHSSRKWHENARLIAVARDLACEVLELREEVARLRAATVDRGAP